MKATHKLTKIIVLNKESKNVNVDEPLEGFVIKKEKEFPLEFRHADSLRTIRYTSPIVKITPHPSLKEESIQTKNSIYLLEEL